MVLSKKAIWSFCWAWERWSVMAPSGFFIVSASEAYILASARRFGRELGSYVAMW